MVVEHYWAYHMGTLFHVSADLSVTHHNVSTITLYYVNLAYPKWLTKLHVLPPKIDTLSTALLNINLAYTVTVWDFLFCFCLYFLYLSSFHYQYLPCIHSVTFLYLCSLVSSLCLCLIWARSQPESASALFGYFRDSGIFIELPSLLVFWNFTLLP